MCICIFICVISSDKTISTHLSLSLAICFASINSLYLLYMMVCPVCNMVYGSTGITEHLGGQGNITKRVGNSKGERDVEIYIIKKGVKYYIEVRFRVLTEKTPFSCR